jgi:hypothetical protein
MKLLNILYRGEEGVEPDDVTFFVCQVFQLVAMQVWYMKD